MVVTNSKAKGGRGEREWAEFLRDRGLSAHRGQQFAGGVESPDVVCKDLPLIHFEVKRVERLNIHDAMTQAIRDAEWKMPVVAHRKNRQEWLVTMRAEDWVRLVSSEF
jgi:Holliday junction resolvase